MNKYLQPMMKNLFFPLVTVLIAGCAPGTYVDPYTNLRETAFQSVNAQSQSVKSFMVAGGTDEQVMTKARDVIANLLKDPGSAQFRNVALRKFSDANVVCGEVNGKNSYGGYVGFRRFVAGTSTGTIEDTDARYPAITAAANSGITAACY